MADYILRNNQNTIALFEKAGLKGLINLNNVSNTLELKERIIKSSSSQYILERLSKFFILRHFYNSVEKTFDDYDQGLDIDLFDFLGSNGVYESIKIQRKTPLKLPFKIYTKRTITLQLGIILVWLLFLFLLHIQFPDLWVFTFHLPITGFGLLLLPVILLLTIFPRIFGKTEFDNIKTLEQLVEETYLLNQNKISENNFSFLSEELNNYINS